MNVLPAKIDGLAMSWIFQWPKQLNASLEEVDPEIADIIELEKARQWKVGGHIFQNTFYDGLCLMCFRWACWLID